LIIQKRYTIREKLSGKQVAELFSVTGLKFDIEVPKGRKEGDWMSLILSVRKNEVKPR
jgi:hypothetical protein